MLPSFMQALDEAFDALVLFKTKPENEAIKIMINFVYERAESGEHFLALRQMLKDTATRLLDNETYAETRSKSCPYYIICEDDFTELAICSLLASMVMYHNLGNGDLERDLIDDDGCPTAAVNINSVIMAELYERENSYLSEKGWAR